MLTIASIKAAQPREKLYKLYDERGLFLAISPCGGKWWRFKFRFDGKEKVLALGVFPDVSFKQARDRRDEARRERANGIDPAAKRRAEKYSTGDSFEAIAREWFEAFSLNWKETHSSKIIRRLELYMFPWIGARPISKLTAVDILACLRRIEAGAKLETAHRALQNRSRVFRYAIATGRAVHDPATNLRGALPPSRESHHAAILDPKEFGELLRAIDAYNGSTVVRYALQLAPLLFARSGELRSAEWSEIDWAKAEWHIPATKMKMRGKHIVPLARQCLQLLSELRPMSGGGKYVFPSPRSARRCLSDNALLAALRRMGYEQGTVTVHGFRSTATTFLNELGKNSDWIERQLAHGERDHVRAAYNYAAYLPQRKTMMQEWADHLDRLRSNRSSLIDGVPIHTGAAMVGAASLRVVKAAVLLPGYGGCRPKWPNARTRFGFHVPLWNTGIGRRSNQCKPPHPLRDCVTGIEHQ
jgi:integrase